MVLPDINLDPETTSGVTRIVLLACGTSYHAAIVARFLIERLTGLPAEVDVASEWRYRDAPVGPETLVVALSQSGEAADTLGAVKTAKARGAPVIAISHPQTRFVRPPAVLLPVGVPGVDHGGATFRTDGVVALPLAPARRAILRSPAHWLDAMRRALPERAP